MQPKEILEELRTVVSGKTVDAMLPPLLFVLLNNLFGLDYSILASLGIGLALALSRLLRKQSYFYALGGLAAAGTAAGFAYFTRSAAGYFIPAITGSALLLLAAVLSLLAGKPLAAWASHITRSWPLDWFWRKDVKPAYREVTILWSAYLLLRLAVQVSLYKAGDATTLAWSNILLGWPVIIAVLITSYTYGMARLRNLGGPGIEEFKAGSPPPWLGQNRGF